jgi:hypothetical protein
VTDYSATRQSTTHELLNPTATLGTPAQSTASLVLQAICRKFLMFYYAIKLRRFLGKNGYEKRTNKILL